MHNATETSVRFADVRPDEAAAAVVPVSVFRRGPLARRGDQGADPDGRARGFPGHPVGEEAILRAPVVSACPEDLTVGPLPARALRRIFGADVDVELADDRVRPGA